VVDVHKVGSVCIISSTVLSTSTYHFFLKKIQSCGFAIPFFTYKAPRVRLNQYAARKEAKDIEAEITFCNSSSSDPPDASTSALSNQTQEDVSQDAPELPVTQKGLKYYWKKHNVASIDGLPGVLEGFKSTKTFDPSNVTKDWGKDDESSSSVQQTKMTAGMGLLALVDVKLIIVFLMGMVFSSILASFGPRLVLETTKFRL